MYELARHAIALSEHWMCIGYVVQCAMFNAFQWNCFNLVDTCRHNIALILFLKSDVTKFRIPPPSSCHTSSTPSLLNVWRNLWMAPNLFYRKCYYLFILCTWWISASTVGFFPSSGFSYSFQRFFGLLIFLLPLVCRSEVQLVFCLYLFWAHDYSYINYFCTCKEL